MAAALGIHWFALAAVSDWFRLEDDPPIGLEDDPPIGLEDDPPIGLEDDRPIGLEDDPPIGLEDDRPIDPQAALAQRKPQILLEGEAKGQRPQEGSKALQRIQTDEIDA